MRTKPRNLSVLKLFCKTPYMEIESLDSLTPDFLFIPLQTKKIPGLNSFTFKLFTHSLNMERRIGVSVLSFI